MKFWFIRGRALGSYALAVSLSDNGDFVTVIVLKYQSQLAMTECMCNKKVKWLISFLPQTCFDMF